MQSIFRYPGGKQSKKIVAWIANEQPDGIREYREPFVGGGGIFFALHTPVRGGLVDQRPFDHVWLNDKHSGLIEVYTALRDRPEEFIAACKAVAPASEDDPMTPEGVRGGKPTNARLKEVFDSVKLNDECDQAFRYFFVNRTVHGSGRVNYDIPSRLYFSNPSGWNIVATRRLADAASVLSGVEITCGDYSELFDADGDGVWIYADPPYVVNSDLSRTSQLYQHGFDHEDHKRFAEVVKRCKHKVCISYDDDDDGIVRSLFADFHIEEGSWAYSGTSVKNSDGSKEKKRRGRELLIMNYDQQRVCVPVMEPVQSDEPLDESEASDLRRLEGELQSAIERKRDAFVSIGLALKAIRDSGKPSKRLYRQTHATFEDYCSERWGFSKQRTYQYLAAFDRYDALQKSKSFDFLPSRESHVAQLARCESDEQAAEVWEAVVEDAPDPSKITAAFIKQYVDAVTGHKPKQTDPVDGARKALLKLDDEQLESLFSDSDLRSMLFRILSSAKQEAA